MSFLMLVLRRMFFMPFFYLNVVNVYWLYYYSYMLSLSLSPLFPGSLFSPLSLSLFLWPFSLSLSLCFSQQHTPPPFSQYMVRYLHLTWQLLPWPPRPKQKVSLSPLTHICLALSLCNVVQIVVPQLPRQTTVAVSIY